MADLITPSDIETLLRVTYTGDDEDYVQLLIDMAVSEIEIWLGRPISITTFIEDYLPDESGTIFLRNTPVVSVESVEGDGITADTGLYRVTPWGIEGLDLSYFWYYSDPIDFDEYPWDVPITVTYRAGLDTPPAVNSLIFGGIRRVWEESATKSAQAAAGAAGAKEITVEDYTVKYEVGSDYSSSYAAGITPLTIFRSDADFVTIKRLKRRGFG